MRLNYNPKACLTTLAMVTAMVIAPSSNAALVNYSQDFEALQQADPAALSNDGWRIFKNVYDTDKTTLLYDYGVFVAPNGGAGFSSITADMDNQQLKTYSDYTNYEDQAAGKWIETLVFQQQTITADDIGSLLNFSFDVKQGDQIPDSSSTAFLKTTAFASILDTTASGTDWATRTLSLEIDSSMIGQPVQFGFTTTATNYKASGVFYDNINFSATSAVPVPGAIWMMMSGLIGLVGVARGRGRKR